MWIASVESIYVISQVIRFTVHGFPRFIGGLVALSSY